MSTCSALLNPSHQLEKLVCIFNRPFHRRNIVYRLYFVESFPTGNFAQSAIKLTQAGLQ